VVDAGGQAELEVLLDNLAGQAAHVLVAYAAVIGALRLERVSVLGKAQRTAIFIEEILLLQANPEVGIVLDGRPRIGGVRRAIGVHDFAENDVGAGAARIRIQSDGLQNTVRLAALGLHGGTAIKSPQGEIGKRGRRLKILQLGFAAQFRNGLLAVKPDVFEFVLGHGSPLEGKWVGWKCTAFKTSLFVDT